MTTSNSKEPVKKNVKKQRQLKTLEDLTIRDDYMFSKVMSFQKICKEFLEAIFWKKLAPLTNKGEEKTVEIEKIEYINVEERIKTTYEHKGIRLDVYIKDKIGTVYNIEMQVINQKNLAKRARYYQAMIDSSLLLKNTDYNLLNKSFIIFICPFKIFDGKKQLYTFKNFCEENKSIELKDDVTKIFISTKGEDKGNKNDDFEALLKYIDGIKTENPFINHIDNRINQIKQDEKERGAYMQYDLHLRQIEKKAKEEGEKIGMTKALFEIAKNMILGNMPLDKIAEFTKLPISEIKKISAQMA